MLIISYQATLCAKSTTTHGKKVHWNFLKIACQRTTILKELNNANVNKLTRIKIFSMLRESNAIEGVYSKHALQDAVKAWDWAYEHRKEPITDEYVLKIHALLLRRLNPSIAGKYRQCGVRVGGDFKMDYQNCPKKVKKWVEQAFQKDIMKYANRGKGISFLYDRDNLTMERHIDFEEIHPFEDGNGRTGRILYNMQRVMLGLPLHIIHEGDELMHYYTLFQQRRVTRLLAEGLL